MTAPTSKKTAKGNANQLPSLFKKANKIRPWSSGEVNFDYGSGPHGIATEFLWEAGVLNIEFDPYHFDLNTNIVRIYDALEEEVDTITISNVLNVIKHKIDRVKVLQRAKGLVENGGYVFISIYEGNKSGVGKQKDDSWQANRTTKDFLEEIRETLPEAKMKYGIIYWKKP